MPPGSQTASQTVRAPQTPPEHRRSPASGTAPAPGAHQAASSRLPLRPRATTGSWSPARALAPSPLSSPAGQRASAACLALSLLGALSGGWALISTGTALGNLLTGSGLLLPVGQAVLTALLSGALQAAALRVSRTSATTQEGSLRSLVLDHLLRLGPDRAADVRSGATVSLLTDGVERVALYRQTFLAPTAAALLAPLLVLAELALVVDVVAPLVLAAAVVVVPACVALLHSRLRRTSSRSRQARARLAADYLDAIQGLGTLTLSRAVRRTSEALRQAGETSRRATMKVLAANQLVILVTDSLFSLLLITAAAVMAGLRLSSGALDAGGALAVVLTSYVLLEPLDRVGAFFYVGMAGLANQRALRDILSRPLPGQPGSGDAGQGAQPPDAPGSAGTSRGAGPDQPDASDQPASPGQPDGPADAQDAVDSVGTVDAEIILRGVDAAWDSTTSDTTGTTGTSGASPVLHDVSLTVARGQHTALVGASGAGKSTLMSLLAGNLLPSRGSLVVHGTTLGPATQDLVRSASALVSQTTWLFTGTLADNLRLARPQATEPQMWQALEDVGLAEEVRGMPDGLDTQVGEAGLGLSGGQAQRVSLARAVLANRPLLLLDEPTSQVDLATEAVIVRAIERLARGRTVVTVSHRRGAVSGADQVITLDHGRLHQGSTHASHGSTDRGAGTSTQHGTPQGAPGSTVREEEQ